MKPRPRRNSGTRTSSINQSIINRQTNRIRNMITRPRRTRNSRRNSPIRRRRRRMFPNMAHTTTVKRHPSPITSMNRDNNSSRQSSFNNRQLIMRESFATNRARRIRRPSISSRNSRARSTRLNSLIRRILNTRPRKLSNGKNSRLPEMPTQRKG